MPKKIDELSEEEVFANDKDPLEALAEIRRSQGEDVPEDLEDAIGASPMDDVQHHEDIQDTQEDEPASDDDEDLSEFQKDEEKEDVTDELSEEQGSAEGRESSEQERAEAAEETGSEETAEQPKLETFKFKANGQEFEFTQEEMNEQFPTVFGKAVDYTQKMQKIAPYRKMISALEAEGITQDQLNIAIDALKGNKEAIQHLIKEHGIEDYDVRPEEGTPAYQPNVYGKTEAALEIEEVTRTIDQDPEYKITVDVIDRQWDQNSRNVIAQNPQMIAGLHNDIKTGLYDKVAPLATRMKVLDGNSKSDLEYYMLAGQQLGEQEQTANSQQQVQQLNQPAQDAESQFDKASSEAQRKRSATSTRARADRKGVIDYLDDDDEAFDKWYDNLMSNN